MGLWLPVRGSCLLLSLFGQDLLVVNCIAPRVAKPAISIVHARHEEKHEGATCYVRAAGAC